MRKYLGAFESIWKWSIWKHVEVFGSIWEHLEAFGSIWKHVEACGSIWEHLEAFGSIWGDLEIFPMKRSNRRKAGHRNTWRVQRRNQRRRNRNMTGGPGQEPTHTDPNRDGRNRTGPQQYAPNSLSVSPPKNHCAFTYKSTSKTAIY